MNSLMFCVVFCFSSSLAFYSHYGKIINPSVLDILPDLVCKPHEFLYRRGDYFHMWIAYISINGSANGVTVADAIVRKQPGLHNWYRQHIKRQKAFTKMEFYLDQDTIKIDVHFSTKHACEIMRVLEGREMSTLPVMANDTKATQTSKNNNICIKENICVFVFSDKMECKDNQLISRACREGDLPGHVPDSDEWYEHINCPTLMDVQTPTQGLFSHTSADNTYFTIMIVTSVTSAIALILLLIIAISQRCWVKPNSQNTPLILPNQTQYYENVVFRPESEPEAEQQQQRVYEETSPENEYEEINYAALS